MLSKDKILDICKRYNLKLTPNVTIRDTGECCPIGALAVEHFKGVQAAFDFYDEACKIRSGVMSLASLVGLTQDQAWGIILGFDNVERGDYDQDYYRLGAEIRASR